MRRSLVLALLLLSLAGAFRLWASDHARFTGDESHAWAKARQVATGRFAPAFGLDVTGSKAKHPGPTYYYLMAIPQTLSASPRAGSAFVIALHLLAGWLLFCLARAARSERAGWLALALFAASPWEILYADRIWGSSVAPVWGAVALYAAHRSRDSKRWQGILLFTCLVLPQIHLSAPVLWLACAVLLFLRPPKTIGWRALGIAALLSLLTYAPAIVSELMTGFENTRAILNKGGGAETLAYALWNPIRVLGYMVLYGSGELGYHFARGYWGGNFDDATAYFTRAGWAKTFAEQGLWWGGLCVVSIALSALAWGASIFDALRTSVQALKARRRDLIDLDRALTLSVLVAFVAAGVLLLVANKRFFPHYANILMPMALWPMAAALDRALDRRWLRLPLAVALVGSLAFMVTNTIRYYLQIDTLNGLANTLTMVKAVLDDDTPAQVSFTHFNNSYAWNLVAQEYYGRPLAPDPSGRVRWVVDNRQRFEGQVPKGAQLHGGVLLRRIPAQGPGRTLGSPTVQAWPKFDVQVQGPDGSVQPCNRASEQATACQYGAQPWQRFGPETMPMGGQDRHLLFMHPVQGSTVRARLPVGPGVRQVILHYGLTDAACQSANRAPVRVTVLDGTTPLGHVEAGNRPGLHTLELTRSSTRAGSLTVQLQTANEGARIFGFDLTLRP